MRFDDRLGTVLTGDVRSARGRAATWRQCADLLCQDGHALAPEISARLLHIIALLGREVPSVVKDTYAESAAPFCNFPPLMTLLARDSVNASRAFAANAQLNDDAWLLLIPELGPVGRAALRKRDDLSGQVSAANDWFSASDFVLPSPTTANAGNEIDTPVVDIRDLVRRIEEYRSRQAEAPQSVATASVENGDQADTLRFSADAGGRIVDIDGAPRGRFVGLDLSQPARSAEEGCDAATARRFSKRSTISFGRVFLTGGGTYAGTWLCHAEPIFAPADGSFIGYAGTLRRPAPHEVPSVATAPHSPSGLSADMVRTLLHELRSPLNAISGYAQMIGGQYAGPVSETYRASAQVILDEANILSATISELDLLSAPEGPAHSDPVEQLDLEDSLNAIINSLRHYSVGSASDIVVDAASPLTAIEVACPKGAADRLLALYLHPLAYRRADDPQITIYASRDAVSHSVILTYHLPRDAMASPVNTGDQRPGLGFAHDAAAAIAAEIGGTLVVRGGQYILNLPLVSTSGLVGEAGA